MAFGDEFNSSDDNFSEEEKQVLELFCKCRDKVLTPMEALTNLTDLMKQGSEVIEDAKV